MTPSPRRLALAGTSLAFALGYLALQQVGFLHWNVANGLLFCALWLLPRRAWAAIALGTVLARSANGVLIGARSGVDGAFLGYWSDPLQYLLGNLLEPGLMMAGVLLLRRWRVRPADIGGVDGMAQLHLAALAAALLLAGKDVAYVLHEGVISDVRRALLQDTVSLSSPGAGAALVYFGIKNLLGHFLGVLLAAPAAAWLAVPAFRAGSRRILGPSLLFMLPVSALLAWAALGSGNSPLGEVLRLLMLGTVAIFALRFGWRGAAATVLVASLAIATEDHLGLSLQSPIWLQLFIAIAGAMALMFGATIDGLRQQAARLQVAERRQSALAEELYDAAARNLQVEERERRRLAADLHDEFGQNLAALQTHLKLAEPDFAAAGRLPVIHTLADLARAMRQNVSRVLESLRPVGLDELGLYGALDRGSVRRLAEDAGLRFDIDLHGDARLLARMDEVHRVAAYRLVQEAVTNVVRHARARRCQVRLRLSQRGGQLWLFVDVRDDGVGDAASLRPGGGLRGQRDRLLALGGSLRLRSLRRGLRVHALLRQPLLD